MNLVNVIGTSAAAGILLYLLIKRKKGNGRRPKNYGAGMLSNFWSVDDFHASQVSQAQNITEQFEPAPENKYDVGRGLAQFILDPLQAFFLPASLSITSWYRSDALNDYLVNSPQYNAVPNSVHRTGGAVDISLYRPDNLGTVTKQNGDLVAAVLAMDLPFNRMLLEGGSVTNPAWVQIEYDPIKTDRKILVLPNGLSGYELTINEARALFNVV